MAAMFPKFDMPYKILEEIAYDPGARDLSVEVAKSKGTGAEALIAVSRLNDACPLTRELVKQRGNPMAVLSIGPGWYEDQYLKKSASFRMVRSAWCPGTIRTRSSTRFWKPRSRRPIPA